VEGEKCVSSKEILDSNPDIRIGTCAWSFEDWRGVFYPESHQSNQRLAYYSRYFRTVEVDSTFYSAPSLQTARNWLDATPHEFLFSCKLPREITHVRKLRGCEQLLEEFLTAIAPLRRKLACVLIQLPSYFHIRQDELALKEFIFRLPADTRFAVEFRDIGWHLPRVAHLLEEHQVCWVWNDLTPLERQNEGAFTFLPQTTDFLYLRLIGDLSTKYRGDGERKFRYRRLMWPRDASLENWALKVRQHAGDVSKVFAYMNNHFEGFAPLTCQRFGEQIGVPVELPSREHRSGDKNAGRQLELFL